MLAAKTKGNCVRSFDIWETVERTKSEHLTALLTAGFHCWKGACRRKILGLV